MLAVLKFSCYILGCSACLIAFRLIPDNHPLLQTLVYFFGCCLVLMYGKLSAKAGKYL